MTRFGAWSMLPSTEAVEALGRSGADFVGLDAQHGAHGFHDLVSAIQVLHLLSVESLIRISELDLELIPRALDFGASGVIVAMVESAETARRAVSLTRYQPEGARSYGGHRYGLAPEPADLKQVRPAVHVMIETRAALERVEDIAAVPGLAGLFVGPVDLALALGVTGELARRLSAEIEVNASGGAHSLGNVVSEPVDAWRRACTHVVEAAHRNRIEAAMFALGGTDARYWSELGFDRVVVGSDIALLRGALKRELRLACTT